MKKNLFLLMTAAALWTACGDNAGSTDASADSTSAINSSADSLASSNTASSTDTTSASSSISSQPLDKKGQDFAKEASDAGKLEIELGQLAQQNGADQRVKDFGAMMVKDHTAAAQELQAILLKKNFTPPVTEDKHAKHKEELAKKTGAEFDKAYIKMMVDGHKKVVKEFEDAEKNSTDPDVKAFAAKTLPVIRTHLDSAEAIAKAKK